MHRELQINRDLAIPIYTQIVGQLQFDIVSGRLPSGTQLPSIRDLAQELNVAPMTITQAYQELRQLGLIEMRPGLGTFVANFDVQDPDSPAPNRQLQLRRILQRAVAEAQSEGFEEAEIKHGFLSLLTGSNGLFTSRYLVLAGLFASALRVYADDIERYLAAERVVIEPISFDQLRSRPDYFEPRLDQAGAILVPLHQVQVLRELLQSSHISWNGPIVGLSFVLRESAKQTIAALPPDTQIGIISRFPEFVNTMVQSIHAVRPLRREPVICLSTDLPCLERLKGSVQAIIYATGADSAVAALKKQLPPGTPFIEFLHRPDEAALQRVRQLIQVPAPTP
ncbi:MAG: GntR family transcriptional regulator [Caldilineaceae bacterium]|nr:GntR family transcriptional regulator [Caldilineaceae bacterium]